MISNVRDQLLKLWTKGRIIGEEAKDWWLERYVGKDVERLRRSQ